MASRRRAREFALQALYQADLGSSSAAESLGGLWKAQLDDALPGRPAVTDEIDFASRLVEGVVENREAIDTQIEAASTNWRLVRMPSVDRNILRLAAFEILYCDDLPVSVSINEAVELAKRFGDKESRSFVNGILDRIASESGLGGRGPRSG